MGPTCILPHCVQTQSHYLIPIHSFEQNDISKVYSSEQKDGLNVSEKN